MNAVMTVIKKEWAEVRRNKLVLSVVLFVPLLMTIIPLIMLALMRRIGVTQSDYEEMRRMLNNPLFAGLDPIEAMQSVSSRTSWCFPDDALMVPVTIASTASWVKVPAC
jgi:ABC-2 type transport system permease protein